jgi:hypothetical protein
LPRIKFKRANVNPSKISGPYSLLALMLLVAEFLFAIWFWKTEGPIERGVAGLILAVVFVSLAVIVLKMNKTQAKKK